MRILLALLIVLIASCSPFKFRHQSFSADGTAFSIAVPKGFDKVENGVDSAGNPFQAYHYGDGLKLYVQKVVNETEWIDTTMHVAQLHSNGSLSFKWMEEDYIYWREVRLKNYRFGYTKVPWKLEIRFDSAINYIRDHSFK